MATERIDIIVSERGSKQAASNIRDIGGAASASASSVRFLQTALGLLVGGSVLRGIIEQIDAYNTLQNRLKILTSSSEELLAVNERLFEVAARTRTSIEATGQLYTRAALAARNLGVSQEQVIKFTETLNKAVILSGASVRESNLALLQFTQGLASNRLAGDELRSVLEQLPTVADLIARQLGVTRGALKDLAAQGKITSDVILAAFSGENADKIASDFEKTIPTIGQQFTVLQTQIQKFIGESDKAFGFTSKLVSVIKLLGENLDVVAKGALGVGLVFALERVIGLVRTLTLAIAANPIGFLLTALTAATVALVAFSDKLTLSSDGIATLQDFFQAFVEFLGSQLQGVLDLFGGVFGELPDLAEVSLKDIIIGAAQFIDRFIGVFVGGFYAVGEIIRNFGENAGPLLTGGLKTAVNVIVDVFNFLPRAAFAAVDGVYNSFTSFFKRMQLAFEFWSQAVNNAFDGNFDKAKENVADALFQIQNGAVNVLDSVRASFKKSEGFRLLDNLSFTAEEQAAAQQLGTDVANAFLKGFSEPGNAEANIRSILERAEQIANDRRLKRAQDEAARRRGESGLGDTPAPSGLKSGRDIAIEQEIEQLQRQAEALRKVNQERDVERELLKITEELRGKNVTLIASEEERFRKLIRAKDVAREYGRVLDEVQGPQLEFERRQQALNQALENGALTASQFAERMRDARIALLEGNRDVGSGFERGFLKWQQQINDFASIAEQTLTNAFNGAEDALVEFVQTGEFNFSKLVDSILADLTRLVARQAISGLLGALTGGSSGFAGSIGGFLFGGARAEGGPVTAGQSYLVGERGPEIFSPSTNGTIIPNGAMGAPPTVNVSVINVTDPDEVTSALNEPQTQDSIVNVIRKNRTAVRQALGV